VLSFIHSRASSQSLLGGLFVPPVSIVGGTSTPLIQLALAGKISGMTNNVKISTAY
jgi:hypothetical protein